MVINYGDLDIIEKRLNDRITQLCEISKANVEAIEHLTKTLLGQADEITQLSIYITNTAEILMAADTALEAQIKTSNTRRRINRSISVKGIVQYEGTVEGHGLTHEEFMVEQAKIDAEIDRLQPQYEEFVEPLPKAL